MTAPEGLIVTASANGVRETVDKLSEAVTASGMTIVARIDHAAAAASIGLELRPTTVLIFGNPRAGTPVMRAVPTLAIDLPLRALVWQDDDGKTWIASPDPRWLAQRHGGGVAIEPDIARMADALTKVVRTAST